MVEEIRAAVAETPLPNILVIAGIVFLILSVAGKITSHLVVPETRKKQSMVLGLVLLAAGLVLNFLPAEKSEWDLMTEQQRASWTLLGWTAESWAANSPKPASEDTAFAELSEAERAAVTQLGYTAEAWDAR